MNSIPEEEEEEEEEKEDMTSLQFASHDGVGEKKKRQDLLLFQYEPHVFSHFSYHSSGRSLLVCDLQGMYDPLCLGVKQGRVTGRHEHTKAAAFQLLMAHSFKLPNQ